MKEENVVKYYVLCNKLKTVIRTGWKDWHVSGNRLESVAEHVYGTEMLALAMFLEYKYDIDITKVIMMLAVHELEETIIGDLTLFDISKEEKEKIGHDAVKKILSNILDGEKINKLILEFDERKTKEAIFAYQCDKLECDIQSKLYDEDNLVDLKNQKDNKSLNNKQVKEMLDKGYSWSKMWIIFGQERYNYDQNFKDVSNYVLKHKIKNS